MKQNETDRIQQDYCNHSCPTTFLFTSQKSIKVKLVVLRIPRSANDELPWFGGTPGVTRVAATACCTSVVHMEIGTCCRRRRPGGTNEAFTSGWVDPCNQEAWLHGGFRKGYPQITHFSGIFSINHPFWGSPIYGNLHIMLVLNGIWY